jgi:DNA mismatch endonuclease (patch repair protein)
MNSSARTFAPRTSQATDVLTPEQRSRCMSRIRGKDTSPELLVRRLIHAMGYRYGLHRRDLPGTPDLVFPRHKRVIFVHGCFWHRHSCRLGRPKPKQNAAFWRRKLGGNAERDKRALRRLRALGWKVLVIWECQTLAPAKLLGKVRKFLSGPVPTTKAG